MTNAKLFSEFYSKFHEHTQESMTKTVEESDSFLNSISKVIVARGSGFKHHESNTGIAPMHTIRHSFSLPRTYFIAPERLDWVTAIKMNTNHESKSTDKDEQTNS